MNEKRLMDRATGSIVGALIGDALGLGPHWYYDLEQLREHFSPWIDGYTDPQPGRYHEGLKAGNLSQTGLITLELLRSVVDKNGYDEADFTSRLDEKFLKQMDGSPYAGPGGYTNQSIRELYKVSLVYGMPCSILCMLPAAYYLAARFQEDFEQAVLHAVNGGGQNMSRAMLTGALVGAQVGLSGIPRRFIDGLTEGREIVDLAQRLNS
jgi:ADP-ribosylglycohydrolase